MNKSVQHVLRLCVTTRNLRRIPRCTAWACYSRTAALPYSSNTNIRDNGLPSAPPSFQNTETDFISQSIWRAETADDIFNIVKQNRNLMKRYNSIQAFKKLDSFYRLKNVSDSSIGKRVEFLQLCEILCNNIRYMDVNNAVIILKGLLHFGIPATSVITQSLLQVIRSSLSQLAFHQLLDLELRLKYCDSTPLSDALKIAIPIMCEIQLKNKMIDTSDVSQLCNVLSFCSMRPGNPESIEMVINALRIIGRNMSVGHARKILRDLCDLRYLPPGYEEVVHNVQAILIKNMNQLTYFVIQVLLGKIVKKVAHHGDDNFYNEEFVDACAKAIVSADFGFQEGVKVLRLLNNLGHTQIRLIDYLAAKCFENPDVLNQSLPSTVIALIIGLGTTDYKPIFWESIQEIVLKNLAKKQYRCKPILLDFAISMAVLDFFDSEIISIVFSQHFIQTMLSPSRSEAYWNLLLLHQSVKLLYPSYKGPWPPERIIRSAIRCNGPSDKTSFLLPILEKSMGGSQYVLSNLKSKLGHHIDHVVVMRKGGYPVAVNSLPEVTKEEGENGEEEKGEKESLRYIEDLQLPAESQVIIVINLPASAYSRNSNRLKGNWQLLLKTLEVQTNHTVIPISSPMWNALMDHEKIPYLMQAIRLKCDTIIASANI